MKTGIHKKRKVKRPERKKGKYFTKPLTGKYLRNSFDE